MYAASNTRLMLKLSERILQIWRSKLKKHDSYVSSISKSFAYASKEMRGNGNFLDQEPRSKKCVWLFFKHWVLKHKLATKSIRLCVHGI